MGTNALKNKDLLHGGKPSSHGRKARRVMRRELMRVSNGQKITDKMVDDALRVFNEGVA